MSERTTSPISVRRPAWIEEFRAFIMRGNVVDPVGGIDFTNIFVMLKGPSTPTRGRRVP
jgi:hypothetical protein